MLVAARTFDVIVVGAGSAGCVVAARLAENSSWVTRYAMRGSPEDFAEWVRLGNIGWGFDDVLPYFTRLENDLDFGAQPWHGKQRSVAGHALSRS